MLTSCEIIVIVFLTSVDCLSRSICTGCLKGRLREVMLSDGVSNNWGTITNPQTRNELSFNGGFSKKLHCCRIEDSSSPPLFSDGRQRLSTCYSYLFPHLCMYVRTYMLNSHLLKKKVLNSRKFCLARSFLLCVHYSDFLNSSLQISSTRTLYVITLTLKSCRFRKIQKLCCAYFFLHACSYVHTFTYNIIIHCILFRSSIMYRYRCT